MSQAQSTQRLLDVRTCVFEAFDQSVVRVGGSGVDLEGVSRQGSERLLELANDLVRPSAPLPVAHRRQGDVVGVEPLLWCDESVCGGQDVPAITVRLDGTLPAAEQR